MPIAKSTKVSYDHFKGSKKLDNIFPSVKKFYTVDKLQGYLLAGRGKNYESCGGFHKAIGCVKHFKTQYKVIKHSCDRMECPICYKNWASKRAEASTIRMLRISEAYKDVGINLGRPKHVVFSPDPDKFLEKLRLVGFSAARKEIYKILKKSGLIGGQLVFHLWRKDKANKNWKLSPHWHVVGWGFLIKSNKFHELFPDWIYENEGNRAYPKNIKKLKHNSLYRTCYYEYSHACKAVESSSHVMTWFGCASYNKLVKETIIDYDTIDCELCQEPFVHLIRKKKMYKRGYREVDAFDVVLFTVEQGVITYFDTPEFGEVYTIKRIDYHFEVKISPEEQKLKKTYEKIYPSFQEWKNGAKIL